MKEYIVKPGFSEPTNRVKELKAAILNANPRIESERALLITESYKETESLPVVLRHAKALEKILTELPVVIRDNELIVGTATIESRSCQIFPEFGPQGLDQEWDTVATRSADPFAISEEVKSQLKEVFAYWTGRTTSELATSLMSADTLTAYHAGLFTVGNYHQGGIGHIAVDYAKVLNRGIRGIIAEVIEAIEKADKKAADWIEKEAYYQATLITLKAVITFAQRYSEKAKELATYTNDPVRKAELLKIADICSRVPEYPATTFHEALQSFWFVQLIIQIESSGHSISPGRFDQYMFPFYEKDQSITQEEAQELLDVLFVKFNDLNKLRDIGTATAFAGYQLWQNVNCGGQTKDGRDAVNALSYMEIESMAHVMLPMPSLSIRVWNGTPDQFLMKAAELARLGGGQPAFYNDEEIITAKVNRGLTLEDARNYAVIGCVEPESQGKENSWADAALFNLPKVLEIAMNNGRCNGKQLGPKTGEFEDFKTFDEFVHAYIEQMKFFVGLLVRACNAVDIAHKQLGQLAFVSTLLEDCIGRGKTIEQGGAVYNFTGPQGIGSANIGNALMAVKKLVFDDKSLSMKELKEAIDHNFGAPQGTISDSSIQNTPSDVANDSILEAVKRVLGENSSIDLQQIDIDKIVRKTSASTQTAAAGNNRYQQIHQMIMDVDKFGNDLDEVDFLARFGSRVYCEELEKYPTPRGGIFNAGLYPVSGNVLFGTYIGATPDGRYDKETIAEGVSPTRGTDVNGPTAAANSVAKLDHFIASNGTLYNMKFSPSAVAGTDGLKNLVSLIRGYFDKKGGHVQFNIIDRQILLDAQRNPQNYKDLVVRVAGYSAQFIALDKTVQDDIIARTEFDHF
ncbi:formate C-acetyltransferase/glycerol dehydratase family glycyl radical enzyme [Niallia circulans]|jgi:pyruvate formate-lyase/glycerol dehydratase family glycyl radical enzyme|uniref:glycyl radical protein n=1 Tax=Niallia circulans TaxID=1397 RepID=UPI000BA7D8C4|nr:glycyl radical protein [Niallia circulans]PAD88050.1 formate C-acetyltransferase/glycerol dehydratase family glycyl radical enzyme [Niallia circulans]